MTEDTEQIARRIREAVEGVRAPDRLHAVVAEESARRRPARRRRVLALGGGLAAATAAIVVALVLVLGSAGGPDIQQAVALAQRPPTTNAPAVDPTNPKRVDLEVGGVWFPNYDDEHETGWRPIGARTDDLDGRRAVTVAYQGSGGPVTYTIVDGAPLQVPDGVRWRDYPRFRAAVLRDDSAEQVIAWEKGGRTCIIAGKSDDVTDLLHAAGQA
jgi:hypothetical protein